MGARPRQLGQAFERLRRHLPAGTPVVFARAVGRVDERIAITTLRDADPANADMATLIIVGSAATRVVGTVTQTGAAMTPSADTGQRTAVTADAASQPKTPVGKLTIQRMLFEERRSAGRIWGGALAVVLVAAAVGGFLVWRHGQNVAGDLEKQVAEQADVTPHRFRQLGPVPVPAPLSVHVHVTRA